MIPVTPAVEPAHFDQCVRQPGRRVLDELARAYGEDEIPADKLPPLWRNVLPDLLIRYCRICSYLCLYIPRGTGAPSVDHMIAKSNARRLAYEWSNYRLACSLMNARKGAVADVLDPFGIEEDWFALELVAFQVVPGEGLPPDAAGAVCETIERLGLNDHICCEARTEYAQDYWEEHMSLDQLVRRAPFVARELKRQGRLRQDDE